MCFFFSAYNRKRSVLFSEKDDIHIPLGEHPGHDTLSRHEVGWVTLNNTNPGKKRAFKTGDGMQCRNRAKRGSELIGELFLKLNLWLYFCYSKHHNKFTKSIQNYSVNGTLSEVLGLLENNSLDIKCNPSITGLLPKELFVLLFPTEIGLLSFRGNLAAVNLWVCASKI